MPASRTCSAALVLHISTLLSCNLQDCRCICRNASTPTHCVPYLSVQVYDDNTAEVRHNINLKITNIKAQLESASRSAAAGVCASLRRAVGIVAAPHNAHDAIMPGPCS